MRYNLAKALLSLSEGKTRPSPARLCPDEEATGQASDGAC